jgi:BTB/POZ domain
VERSRSISDEMLYLDEPVCRVLLLMLLSPCNYVSRKSRSILSVLFKPCYDPLSQLVARILCSLHSVAAGGVPTSQAIIDLNILGCLSIFPQYQTLILERNGLNILLDFIKGRLESDILVNREKLMPHLRKIYLGIKCCSNQIEDWEGADLPLFYALVCFSQLIDVSNYGTQDSINSLFWHILGDDRIGEGPKSYCAYILSLFGLYGFRSNFGRKIGKVFDMKELADMRFMLSDGYSFDIHGAILAARCPKLVPLNVEALSNKKTMVKMSERVDKEALDRILSYVYSGFTEMDDFDKGGLKRVKLLTSNCSLHSLLQFLNKEWPKWGSCGPHFDLTRALGPDGHPFS